jgi:hypothetical protein
MKHQNILVREQTRAAAEKDTPPDQLDFAIEELESRISFVSVSLNASQSVRHTGSSSSTCCLPVSSPSDTPRLYTASLNVSQ